MSYVSLDTSAIVEYIDVAGAFHTQARAIFDSIRAGEIFGILAHPILAETYYVSLRIYERLDLEEPAAKAQKLLEWLYRSPHMELAEPTLELALEAGQIKREYGLALTDAYVLASSKLYKGKAVFRTREKEFQRKIAELTEKYNLLFLEDFV